MSWLKAKAKHLQLGVKGEKLAARLVKELGLDVLCCNYRTNGGEIDIVALDDNVICFIEVKSRDNKKKQLLERPADAVGFHKKKRLRKAARSYLYRIKNKNLGYRFDVIEMIFYGRILKASYWLTEYFTMQTESYQDVSFDFE